MLRLTKRIDYGLMAIQYMGSLDVNVNAKMISEFYRLPPELLAKILQKLVRGGIIVSHNGPKGGYTLSRDLDEITVGEVIRAIEGPVRIASCYENQRCEHVDLCTVRTPFRKIQDSLTAFLDSMTVEDLYRQDEPLPAATLNVESGSLSGSLKEI